MAADDPLSGLVNLARRGKTRRASAMQWAHGGPAPPTWPQIQKLGNTILALDERGHIVKAQVEAFARFANCYEQGPLTRVHYIHAIELAMTGRNIYGTADDLVKLSMEPDTILEPNDGEFQRRMIARRKAMKKPGAGNARNLAPTMKELNREKAATLKELEAARLKAMRDRFS